MLTLLLLACNTAPKAPVFGGDIPYLDGEVLLQVNGDDVDQMNVQDDNGLAETDYNAPINVQRVTIPAGKSVDSVIAKLSDDTRVSFAEPNILAFSDSGGSTSTTANDPYMSYQWNMTDIQAQQAWAYGTGNGVLVAVIDSGLKTGGPDGVANVQSGYDFYNGDSNPTDDNGHGTFCAGTIAQNTNNGVGVAGIAPGVKILPVKVMGSDGSGDVATIASGITWATDQGAKVISMSLGSSSSSSTLSSAVAYAYGKGVTIVAASGNDYSSTVGYPAAYPGVIAVGAAGIGGTHSAYSNTGTNLDITAPGGDLSLDANNDGYADGILQETYDSGAWTYTFWEGTSMATPHVAAAAALVIAQGVTNPDDVAAILESTATDKGSSGYDTTYGYGYLNVYNAVVKAHGGTSSSSGSSSSGSSSSGSSSSGSSSSGSSSSGSTADTTPPTISSVSGYTRSSKFYIKWTTNESATSYVNFTDYGTYGNTTMKTAHSLSFTGSAGSTYTFTITSADAAGNSTTSSLYSISL